MHKKLIALTLLFTFIAPAWGAATHRGGAELLNPKGYSIGAGVSMFNTSAYFDLEGTEQTMAEGRTYRLIDVDLSISYGYSKNLELTAFGRLRSVTSETESTSTGAEAGPESIAAEVKYGFDPMGKLRYAVGAHYRQTLYTNSTYNSYADIPVDEVILGDSGSEYGVDLFVTYSDRPWKFDGKIGYNSPANDLSEEIVYKAEGMYRFGELSLFLGVDGIKSLENDPNKESPALKPIQATGNSALFNSINREKLAPYVGANYVFDNMIATLKGQTVAKGISTDKGTTIAFNLTWTAPGITPEAVKVDSFKEYHIDGSVLKVSARGNFVKIDQGISTDVEKGMKFDIYQTDYFGGNMLVASGVAYEVGVDWSIIKIVKKYKEIQIKPGFAARGY